MGLYVRSQPMVIRPGGLRLTGCRPRYLESSFRLTPSENKGYASPLWSALASLAGETRERWLLMQPLPADCWQLFVCQVF